MSLFTTNGGKSVLRPEQVNSLVVQPLIEQSIATQVSTVVQVANNSLRIPVVTGDPVAAWTPEGSEIAVSDQELTEVVVRPTKLAALSIVSNELAADSSPAALQVVGDGLVRDLKRRVDEAFFGAVANPEAPKGIATLAGVTEVLVSDTISVGAPLVDGATGTSMDWAILAKSYAEIHNSAITAFVTSPGRAAWLEMLKESEISQRSLIQPDPTSPTGRRIAGIPLYTTPACDDNDVWCIPKAHTFVAIRQDGSVVADSSAYFSSDQTALRAIMRVGFGFSYAAAVVKIRFDRPLLGTPPKGK